MENPIKMDDLGVPPFSETPISFYLVSFVDPSDLWLAGRSTRWYTDPPPWPPCCVVRASVAPNNVPNGQKRARGICATAPVVDLG